MQIKKIGESDVGSGAEIGRQSRASRRGGIPALGLPKVAAQSADDNFVFCQNMAGNLSVWFGALTVGAGVGGGWRCRAGFSYLRLIASSATQRPDFDLCMVWSHDGCCAPRSNDQVVNILYIL